MHHRSVCFINLKGGVGKSTLSVAFAEYLAFVRGQKVLFIDGDPQCNSTAMLVGTREARDLDKRSLTLYDYIRKTLNDRWGPDIEDFVRPFASNIAAGRTGCISLLPSTIRFADYERLLMRHVFIRDLALEKLDKRISSLVDRLESATTERHEWVVVDAPPSFNLQGRFVIRLARHAVIPTTPDPLAASGTNFVIERLKMSRLRTEPVAVVISKYRNRSLPDKRFVEAIRIGRNPPVEHDWPGVIATLIPESTVLQRISDFDAFDMRPRSFSAKYGQETDTISDMSEEIITLVRDRQPPASYRFRASEQ
ncbi:MAG: ParA family protein [Thermodesulfobacteriota bacterium]